MNLISGRNTPAFAKDTVYRFMKMIQINWIRFTTILAGRIIKEAIRPFDSEERVNVLIIDDSMFERNRSKKVELLTKAGGFLQMAAAFQPAAILRRCLKKIIWERSRIISHGSPEPGFLNGPKPRLGEQHRGFGISDTNDSCY
ncbi:MAG: hypothetical protein SPF95_05735 [Eisenbergiella porci]|nr:hypothetical protein [Eisenbergiella porci]MDY5525668.1 hypothetical protein [Eisenbergiella porci]